MACKNNNNSKVQKQNQKVNYTKDTLIIDANYTFSQAIKGCNAPDSVIKQLILITIHYYSTDNRIHQGQLLINKKIANKVNQLFALMLKKRFCVSKVIPIVRYNWDDNASMADNNSYSFCYRNISYSKHAVGMAVDINPFYNPLRWKGRYSYRQTVPVGAKYNPSVNGTFTENSEIVAAFHNAGFRWGHTFTRNYDDHHFEYRK